VRVESPRGSIEVRARIGPVMEGAVFAPFHYGHFDPDGTAPDPHRRQANALTMTDWDPVSKQPTFKTAACQVTRIDPPEGASRPDAAPAGTDAAVELVDGFLSERS
jgi:anaerobic selenocysteine-containing dehydrogenase